MFPVGERGVIFASPYERIHAPVRDMDTFLDFNFSHNNQLRVGTFICYVYTNKNIDEKAPFLCFRASKIEPQSSTGNIQLPNVRYGAISTEHQLLFMTRGPIKHNNRPSNANDSNRRLKTKHLALSFKQNNNRTGVSGSGGGGPSSAGKRRTGPDEGTCIHRRWRYSACMRDERTFIHT